MEALRSIIPWCTIRWHLPLAYQSYVLRCVIVSREATCLVLGVRGSAMFNGADVVGWGGVGVGWGAVALGRAGCGSVGRMGWGGLWWEGKGIWWDRDGAQPGRAGARGTGLDPCTPPHSPPFLPSAKSPVSSHREHRQ